MLSNIDSYQFIVRGAGFFVFFSLEVLFVKVFVDFGLSRIDLSKVLNIPSSFPVLLMIFGITFFFVSRNDLTKLKAIAPFNFLRFFILLAINMVFLMIFFLVNLKIMNSPEEILKYQITTMFIWYVSAIGLTDRKSVV